MQVKSLRTSWRLKIKLHSIEDSFDMSMIEKENKRTVG